MNLLTELELEVVSGAGILNKSNAQLFNKLDKLGALAASRQQRVHGSNPIGRARYIRTKRKYEKIWSLLEFNGADMEGYQQFV